MLRSMPTMAPTKRVDDDEQRELGEVLAQSQADGWHPGWPSRSSSSRWLHLLLPSVEGQHPRAGLGGTLRQGFDECVSLARAASDSNASRTRGCSMGFPLSPAPQTEPGEVPQYSLDSSSGSVRSFRGGWRRAPRHSHAHDQADPAT